MFLSTLREIINSKPECLAQFINELMPLYLSQASSDDEPIRNIVAESIGKLYVTHPDALSKMLLDALQSTDAVVIATCAKAFKYSAHKTKQAPPHFGQFIDILINLIPRNDLAIKKHCMDSLSQIAFNSDLRALLQDKVDVVVDRSLMETPIKKELIVTVDLGPFKHVVDHGAPIRKSAFTLLENMCEKF